MRFLLVSLALVGCASSPVVATTPPDACPDHGWCWTRGRPLVVDGDREVVAFGAEGSFLRWDGDRWQSVPVPTERWLTSAWSDAPDDGWASDALGGAWHWDGIAWRDASDTQPIARVLGAPDGTPWAIAGGGDAGHGELGGAHLIRRDGDRWVVPFDPFPYCVGGDFAFGPDGAPWSAGLVCGVDGHVVGLEVHRWDGGWRRVGERIEGQGWYPSFASSGAQVVVEASGRFAWDGTAWRDAPLSPPDVADDETVLSDGLAYTRVPIALGCEGVLRRGADAWCFGRGRIALSRDEGPWEATLVDSFERTSDASAWGTIPPVVWAGGDTVLAWGASATDVYRVRPSRSWLLEHWDGTAWTVVLDAAVHDLDGDDDGEVWLATDRGPMHGAGTAWTIAPLAGDVIHVEVVDGTPLALTSVSLFAFSAGAWTDLYDATDDGYLQDVDGTDLGDLWVTQHAAGRTNEMLLLHTVRGSFERVDVPGLASFGTLLSTPAGIWLASDGFVQRLDGAPIAMPMRFFDASMWADTDALWLTTTTSQALRYEL